MIQERNQAHFRERKPMPKLKSQPKVIQDSDFQLNPVWLRVSAGSLPKCHGFIILPVSVISLSVVKWPMTV